MKKILFVHHAVGWGGAPKCMINLINELKKENYNITVLLLRESIICEKLKENEIQYEIASSNFYKKYYQFFPHSEAGYIKWYQVFSFIKLSIIWLLSRYYFAKKELANLEFDIVHLNSSVLTDFIIPSKYFGKVIIHIREPFRKGKIDLLHYFFRNQINKVHSIIAISKDNAQRLNLIGKTSVIYDFYKSKNEFVDTSSYKSKKYLYLGGSSTSKGFYTLVDSLNELDDDIIIQFAGHYAECNKRNQLYQVLFNLFTNCKNRNVAIKKIKSHPNAEYLGLIHNIDKYLNEACCLISPFIVSHFSFPVVEANLNYKPVIASNIKGMEEQITHNQTGFMVKKNSSKELAAIINKTSVNPAILKTYGYNANKDARGKYDLSNINFFLSIYRNI